MVAGCPVLSCLVCEFPGISFMDCPKWCRWAFEQQSHQSEEEDESEDDW